jgi:hypothetical protein
MGGRTRAVSRKRLGKYVPATTNRRAATEVLLESGVSAWSVQRSYKEDSWGDQVQLEGSRRSERT